MGSITKPAVAESQFGCYACSAPTINFPRCRLRYRLVSRSDGDRGSSAGVGDECSAPEINGPVVQQKFTFLLRETCSPSPSVTVGAVARNGCRAGAGVSRGRSTESNEPANPDGLTTREGLNLAGRTRPSVVLTRSDEGDRLSIWAAITMAEKEWLLHPQGLPGTAVRGPACTVVWELGGATLPATRLGGISTFGLC